MLLRAYKTMTPEQFKERYHLNDISYIEICLKYGYDTIEYGSKEEIDSIVVSLHTHVIKFIPPNDLTENIYKILVGKRSAECLLKDVPVEGRTERLCELLCLSNPGNLLYVPQEFLTTELCFKSLKERKYINFSFDEKFIERIVKLENYEQILVMIIKGNHHLIKRIPISEQYLTRDMYYILFESYFADGDLLELVPEQFRDYDMCMKAVETKTTSQNSALKWVPKQVLTHDMVKKAILKNRYAMFYIPDEEEYYDLYEYGLRMYKSLDCISESKITREMCKLAIQLDVNNARYVPERFKTMKTYKKICESGTLDDVPVEVMTEAMCITALMYSDKSKLERVLKMTPEHLRTETFFMEYIRRGGQLKHVARKTKEMCIIAVERKSSEFNVVPKHLIDEEMCLLAIRKDCNLKNIPDNKKTETVCLEFLKKYRPSNEISSFIPENMWTETMYMEGLKHNRREVFTLLPLHLFTEKIMDELLKGRWNSLELSRTWTDTFYGDDVKMRRYKFIKLCRYAHKKRFTRVMNELVYRPNENFPLFKRLKTEFDESSKILSVH